MVCGRIGWIREDFLPPFEIAWGPKLDDDEEAFSGARDPRFGDEATLLQTFYVVVEEVNDAVEYLFLGDNGSTSSVSITVDVSGRLFPSPPAQRRISTY